MGMHPIIRLPSNNKVTIQQNLTDADIENRYSITWSSTFKEDNYRGFNQRFKKLPSGSNTLSEILTKWNILRRSSEDNYEKYYDKKILLDIGNEEPITITKNEYTQTLADLWKKVITKNPNATTLSLIVEETKKIATVTIVDKNIGNKVIKTPLDEKLCNIYDFFYHNTKERSKRKKPLYASSEKDLKENPLEAEHGETIGDIKKKLKDPSTIFLSFPLESQSKKSPTAKDNSNFFLLVVLGGFVVLILIGIKYMKSDAKKKVSK